MVAVVGVGFLIGAGLVVSGTAKFCLAFVGMGWVVSILYECGQVCRYLRWERGGCLSIWDGWVRVDELCYLMI